MKKLFVIGFILSLSLLAATSPLKKKLIGVWKIESMQIKGTTMRHQQMGNPFIEFNDEGGFMIKIGASAEKGRYSVKGNEVTLKFVIPRKPSQKMNVTKIDDRELDYTTSDSTGVTTVTCYRITEGLSGEKD